MSVQKPIHELVVEIFQSGAKWWIDTTIPRAVLSWSLLILFLLSNWHNLVFSKQGTKSHNGHGMLVLHLSYNYSCHCQTKKPVQVFLHSSKEQTEKRINTRERPEMQHSVFPFDQRPRKISQMEVERKEKKQDKTEQRMIKPRGNTKGWRGASHWSTIVNLYWREALTEWADWCQTTGVQTVKNCLSRRL